MLFLLRSLIVPANTIFFKPILDASMGYTTATDQLARFLKIVCSFQQLHSKFSTSQCNSRRLTCCGHRQNSYFNLYLADSVEKKKIHKMNFLYLSAWHFMNVSSRQSVPIVITWSPTFTLNHDILQFAGQPVHYSTDPDFQHRSSRRCHIQQHDFSDAVFLLLSCSFFLITLIVRGSITRIGLGTLYSRQLLETPKHSILFSI